MFLQTSDWIALVAAAFGAAGLVATIRGNWASRESQATNLALAKIAQEPVLAGHLREVDEFIASINIVFEPGWWLPKRKRYNARQRAEDKLIGLCSRLDHLRDFYDVTNVEPGWFYSNIDRLLETKTWGEVTQMKSEPHPNERDVDEFIELFIEKADDLKSAMREFTLRRGS